MKRNSECKVLFAVICDAQSDYIDITMQELGLSFFSRLENDVIYVKAALLRNLIHKIDHKATQATLFVS